MHIPESSHKYGLLGWALSRLDTGRHLYLGTLRHPVDLLTDSAAEIVVYEVLTGS